MGFFSNIFNIGKAHIANNINPNYVCEIIIDGQKHTLLEFDINFSTLGDQRHISMYAVFDEKISPELESWITRSSERKNGTVKFFLNKRELNRDALFTLSFSNAVCTRYKKITKGKLPVTILVMATKHVRLQDEEFMMN